MRILILLSMGLIFIEAANSGTGTRNIRKLNGNRAIRGRNTFYRKELMNKIGKKDFKIWKNKKNSKKNKNRRRNRKNNKQIKRNMDYGSNIIDESKSKCFMLCGKIKGCVSWSFLKSTQCCWLKNPKSGWSKNFCIMDTNNSDEGSSKKCWSVDKRQRTTDQWCTQNCLHIPPHCPKQFCKCEDEEANDYPSYPNNYPNEGANDYPNEEASDYPNEGAIDYPNIGTNDYPNEGANDYPNEGANDYPNEGTNDYPNEGANDYPNEGANDYPNVGANDYPIVGANDYPNVGSNDYPNERANDYPNEGANDYPNVNNIKDIPCMGCPQESEVDDDITFAAAHATASLSGISESGCGGMKLVKVENAKKQVVAGTNFFLTLRLETREGQGCADKIEKICENIVVFKPLPFACQSDDGCLELTRQTDISCKPVQPGVECGTCSGSPWCGSGNQMIAASTCAGCPLHMGDAYCEGAGDCRVVGQEPFKKCGPVQK